MNRRGAGIFVSGTDTEVGKTYVTCLLCKRLREEGRIIRPFKPVESGCGKDQNGNLIPADATALRDVAAPGLAVDDVCFYRLDGAGLAPPGRTNRWRHNRYGQDRAGDTCGRAGGRPGDSRRRRRHHRGDARGLFLRPTRRGSGLSGAGSWRRTAWAYSTR